MTKFLTTKLTGLVVLVVMWSGCATFEPKLRYTDLLRPRNATIGLEKDDFIVSIEEFASSEKSRQAFDADLVAHRILPLLVRLDNNSTKSYRVRQIDINASMNGEALPTIYADKAADDAGTSEYAGKALGWTLATGPFFILFWPVTIAGSAAHTASVNRRIEQHFANMEFTDKLLKPKQSAAGFVYFKLPNKTKTIDSITVAVEVREEESGSPINFKLSLPSLDLTALSQAVKHN